MRIKMNWARPDMKALNGDGTSIGITMDKTTETTTINAFGVVGDEWDGMTASNLVGEIQSIKTPIVMKLNTPGGLVDEALSIYDALIDHPQDVRVDITGQAWSAGTIIASAADEIRISPAGRYGVHLCHSGFILMGNKREIEAQKPQIDAYLESLDKLDNQIAGIIAERSGNDPDTVINWMEGKDGVDGTEFVGVEAVVAGLADSLIKKTMKAEEKAPAICDKRVALQKLITMRYSWRANKLRLMQAKMRANLTPIS